ncbi:hypothetical protein BATDEDRAFT_24830 [Batrachochytrium dendrobatidis JAM81]|uniref:RRM domain-containing protein n=1 Tax=Batrachochytrium dendrobatidis (strain JAM81 / FGSC 10211) TaxID=684364 RepID=F4P2V2_BATDJ|nr:uncharacterized protein BATDEDRAFT_24830 [Batrachochytrium dendrobatidis JAM81]EGF80342.1 hypothetical protein BATDEDRAFT_24830 [Batrachochytrium dendrobatidis JAM81]|eukprot:XP_006678936.1 hypothetical protein BATDEDRAFT_24830 [Batrachochytrium dendrobatidis JAM81]
MLAMSMNSNKTKSVKSRLGPKSGKASAGTGMHSGFKTGGVSKKSDLRDSLSSSDLRSILKSKPSGKPTKPSAHTIVKASAATTTPKASGSHPPKRQGKQSNIEISFNSSYGQLRSSAFSEELAKIRPLSNPSVPTNNRIFQMAVKTTSESVSPAISRATTSATHINRSAALSTADTRACLASNVNSRNHAGFAIEVCNLHPTTSIADLKLAFESLGSIRQVEWINTPGDNTCLSAYIVYDEELAGRTAISRYNNMLADGKILKVTHVNRGLAIAGIASSLPRTQFPSSTTTQDQINQSVGTTFPGASQQLLQSHFSHANSRMVGDEFNAPSDSQFTAVLRRTGY